MINKFIFFLLLITSTINFCTKIVLQSTRDAATQIDKNFYLETVVKPYFEKLHESAFMRYVYENAKNSAESKIIQRYFNWLARYVQKNYKDNIDISDLDQYLSAEDIYYITTGHYWGKWDIHCDMILLPGFNPNDPEEKYYGYANCPKKKDIIKIYDAIKKVNRLNKIARS